MWDLIEEKRLKHLHMDQVLSFHSEAEVVQPYNFPLEEPHRSHVPKSGFPGECVGISGPWQESSTVEWKLEQLSLS